MWDRRVLVVGAGVSGRSAAAALVERGAAVVVTATNPDELRDLPGVTTAPGLVEPPEGVGLVVTSPGVRPDNPLLAAAAARGIEVIGEVELAWRLDQERERPARWLVVTGTNGKTTTVGMLEAMLRAAGLHAVACGNIGLPVVDAVRAGYEVLAVELSSFQLHWSPSVRPFAGAVLNVEPDHLDWHGTLDAYTAAKARAFLAEVAVGGLDDPGAARLLAAAPAPRRLGFTLGEPGPDRLGVRDGRLVDTDGAVLAAVEDVNPPGPSGVLDALAAAALARLAGALPTAIRDGLRVFEPAAHRGAVVAEHDGVRYVDNSKATNPPAAAAALRGCDSVVWLAGGLLKGADVDGLVADHAHRFRGVVLIGADRAEIAAALARHAPDVPLREVSSGDDGAMTEAVRAAADLARPGDVVLLAPAAASWDMFRSYGHRGDAFAEAARNLERRE
ncbi:MAG TPA: UDP-N-acetylmuramoyl-L-alanine--D-glutamate ligase [Pseudonocardiaceae bacterium]